MRPKRAGPIIQGTVFLSAGVILSYFGYLWRGASLNPNELLGSFLFWYAVVYLILAFPLRRATHVFSSYIRRPFGAAVFAIYITIHLVLYGFLLEAILASVYGGGVFGVSPGFLLTTNFFSPPSLTSVVFDLAYNPSIILTLPPVFSAALSFYSISAALIIAVLVVASVGKTREIGELCTKGAKARSLVVLPALGIVFGASCCLSVAGLVGLTAPQVSLLTSVIWIYYITFFILPATAAALLYFNLRSIEKISAALTSPN